MAQLHGFIRPPTWWTISSTTCGRFQTFLLFIRGFLFYFKQCSFIGIGVVTLSTFCNFVPAWYKNQFLKNRTNTICVLYRDLSISLPFFEILSLLYIRKCCFNVFDCRQLALYVFWHELRQLIFGDTYWLIG